MKWPESCKQAVDAESGDDHKQHTYCINIANFFVPKGSFCSP